MKHYIQYSIVYKAFRIAEFGKSFNRMTENCQYENVLIPCRDRAVCFAGKRRRGGKAIPMLT